MVMQEKQEHVLEYLKMFEVVTAGADLNQDLR